MITRPSLRTTRECLERAETARTSAGVLIAANDDWFVSPLFYSAYHLVRAALIDDPIFDSPELLRARDARLTPECRFLTRHQGRLDAEGRSLGINDVVGILYPAIAVEYARLHMASRAIRYGDGLGVITAQSVHDDYAVIRDAWDSGLLSAAETDTTTNDWI